MLHTLRYQTITEYGYQWSRPIFSPVKSGLDLLWFDLFNMIWSMDGLDMDLDGSKPIKIWADLLICMLIHTDGDIDTIFIIYLRRGSNTTATIWCLAAWSPIFICVLCHFLHFSRSCWLNPTWEGVDTLYDTFFCHLCFVLVPLWAWWVSFLL